MNQREIITRILTNFSGTLLSVADGAIDHLCDKIVEALEKEQAKEDSAGLVKVVVTRDYLASLISRLRRDFHARPAIDRRAAQTAARMEASVHRPQADDRPKRT